MNRLEGSTSPYLRQHAGNPVDWYPWGPEALARARHEDKPILLSIGYAACHWCHVMAHESFEDAAVAGIINERFIAIKVDREERPDLDSVYMQAVQAITGSGGWPLTVFLTPAGLPYFGGAYFPPRDAFGRPSFTRVLLAASEAFRTRRDEVLKAAGQIMPLLQAEIRKDADLAPEALEKAAAGLVRSFDPETGGFGSAPKFPQSMALEFLLDREPALVERSLEAMARGGIYDQLGGGFHRYSTDAYWLVPHFEKMLYDNALLARLYLHAYQRTGRPLYRRIVEETLDFVLQDMAAPEGGFIATLDADAEGVEGKYYVWRFDEIESPDVAAHYGATEAGNFEGANVLSVPEGPVDQLPNWVLRERARLLAARRRRVRPGRDDKVLVAWNGLMIRALAEAGPALDRPDYTIAAESAAETLLSQVRRQDGRLLRSAQGTTPAFLEDYGALGLALLSLNGATGSWRWLQEAVRLATEAVSLFWDDAGGLLYHTGIDAEKLIVRPRDVQDNATPSGNALACELLLRLSTILGREDWRRIADRVLRGAVDLAVRYPLGFGHMLQAVSLAIGPSVEVTVVGQPGNAAMASLLSAVHRVYSPGLILVAGEPGTPESEAVALLAGRPLVNGLPAAYLCRNSSCAAPVTDPDALVNL